MKNKFIDLFAGIGGFHLAIHDNYWDCVYASENDKYARKTYEKNFKKISPLIFKNQLFNDDILKENPKDIPNHNLLCAGFPCQPFSQAGYKKGFSEDLEDRGNMFFVIRNIIAEKRPDVIFLENVRHLLKHDGGRTFTIIKDILENELDYNIKHKIIKASDYGLPQHRPRIFIIGFPKEDIYPYPFTFPEPQELKLTMSDIWKGKCDKKIGFTLRVGGRGSNINDRRNWDSYIVNGKVVKLEVEQGKKMMGFPETFEFPVCKTQTMKQLGNSVAVNAIRSVADGIKSYLKLKDSSPIFHNKFQPLPISKQKTLRKQG
ncbi:MAG: DNA (cytosine-5-)-methyltransferase [Candidatus Marinimicrobia bacterium]|nr:DNA (cytosine-5-)-methyltransferase [Candidatus Neomarinimicrobiota bacterium]